MFSQLNFSAPELLIMLGLTFVALALAIRSHRISGKAAQENAKHKEQINNTIKARHDRMQKDFQETREHNSQKQKAMKQNAIESARIMKERADSIHGDAEESYTRAFHLFGHDFKPSQGNDCNTSNGSTSREGFSDRDLQGFSAPSDSPDSSCD